jgi:hypothetical protein
MITITSKQCFTILLLTLFVHTQAQELRTFNTNSYSKSIPRLAAIDNWIFGAAAGSSFALKGNESSLFRGNGLATKVFGNYYFGAIGLGFSSGIITGSTDNTKLNSFIAGRGFPQDKLEISKSNPFNSYLLLGPSFRFGNRVVVDAHVQGGLFFNNPGSVTIGQSGTVRSFYSFEGSDKNAFPGFSGAINIAYPINQSTQFFITTNYLQSSTAAKVYDPKQGIDVATVQNRDVKIFTAGVGIIKSFTTKRGDAGDANASKKHVANIKYSTISRLTDVSTDENIIIVAQDHAINTKGTGAINGRLVNNESCGPVTLKTTSPDGSSAEMIFACPDDAIQYNERISMNVTVPRQTQGSSFGEKVNAGLQATGSALSQGAALKQTQGATFGEKVNAGLHAAGGVLGQGAAPKQTQGATFGEKVNAGLHAAGSALSQGASLLGSALPGGIISGTVGWNNAQTFGIVTNQNMVSSVSTLAGGSGGGAAAASYAATGRMSNNSAARQGILTSIYVRAATTGKAAERKTYRLFFSDQGSQGVTINSSMGSVQSNPLYQGSAVLNNPLYNNNGSSGNNPLFDSKKTIAAEDCALTNDPLKDIMVQLIDLQSSATVATTKTGRCGDFFFANVPEGQYIVKITGTVKRTKGYDINTIAKTDIAGIAQQGDEQLQLVVSTDNSNNADSRSLSSNIKILNVGIVDAANGRKSVVGGLVPGGSILSAMVDSDPIPGVDVILGKKSNRQSPENGAALLGGSLPGGAVISAALRPGDPIPGIDVKLGKNPGGNTLFTTQTNGNGEFVCKGLDAGNYVMLVEEQLLIDDETTVTVEGANQRKGWDGSVKGGSITTDAETNKGWDGSVKGNSIINNDPQQKGITQSGIKRTDQSIVNTTRSNTKDFIVSINELENQLAKDKSLSAAALNKAKEQTRTLKTAVTNFENSLQNLEIAGGAEADLNKKINAMDTAFTVLQATVNSLGDNYTPVSTVLKTKHDTVKNSVGNIR